MSEEEFVSYFGKDIKIITKDGRTIIGHVISFTWAVDSDDNEAELELRTKMREGNLVGQSEVKSIEVINT